MGKNIVQANQCLNKCCSDSAPLRQTVEKWFVDFKRGRINTYEADHPKSAVVPENKKECHKMILLYCKFKLQEITPWKYQG